MELKDSRNGLRGFLKDNESNIVYAIVSNPLVLYDIDIIEDLEDLENYIAVLKIRIRDKIIYKR